MGTGIGDSRPAQDLSGETEKQTQAREAATQQASGVTSMGLNCDYIPEKIPVWDLATAEEILGGEKSNAFIIIGRDRPSSKASGQGGAGSTGAGSIHLVAGLNGELKGNPSFSADAATIHLSQLTDIDKNFGLCEGVVGSKEMRSGIGLKADGIRVIAREGIKLITTGRGDRNSHGKKVETTTGIDLIAGNVDSELEPILKGHKTVEALNMIIDRLNKVSGLLNNFVSAQQSFNTSIMAHTHTCFPIPLVATPSPEIIAAGAGVKIRSLVQTQLPSYQFGIGNTLEKIQKLDPVGADYICSRFNNVN
jgi:hypothetical protein